MKSFWCRHSSQSRLARFSHQEVPHADMQIYGKPNDVSILVAIGTYQRAYSEPEGWKEDGILGGTSSPLPGPKGKPLGLSLCLGRSNLRKVSTAAPPCSEPSELSKATIYISNLPLPCLLLLMAHGAATSSESLSLVQWSQLRS